MRQIVDGSGVVQYYQSFEPYGDVLESIGVGESSYGFAGEWTDSTGLQYLRARYYNSGIGRFTTRDTYSGDYQYPLSLNRWMYVSGNPVMYIDPSGNISWMAVGAAVGGLIGYVPQVIDNFQSGQTGSDGLFKNIDYDKVVGGAIAGAGVALLPPLITATASELLVGASIITGTAGVALTNSNLFPGLSSVLSNASGYLGQASYATYNAAQGLGQVLYGPVSGTLGRIDQAAVEYQNAFKLPPSSNVIGTAGPLGAADYNPSITVKEIQVDGLPTINYGRRYDGYFTDSPTSFIHLKHQPQE